MGRRENRDEEPAKNADELDLAIARIRSENPTWPLRVVTTELNRLGFNVTKSTVHRRISKFPESDHIKLVRKAFVALLDQGFQEFAKKVKAGDYQALRDLIFGTGVLSHTQNIKTGDLPPDEEGLVDELDRYDTKRLLALRDKLRARRSDNGDPGESVPADDGLVSGKELPSNA